MILSPRVGCVVGYWDEQGLAIGVVESVEPKKARLLDRRGRPLKIATARIVLEIESSRSEAAADPGAVRDRLDRVEKRIEELSGSVDVPLLWSINDSTEVDIESMSELALEQSSGEACAAVMRAFLADGLHFERKGTDWRARDAAKVEALGLARRQQQQRETEREVVLESFAVLAREAQEAGAEPRLREDLETTGRYLESLEQLAVNEDLADERHRALAKEALDASGLRFDRPAEGAFRLLRLCGRFESDDENLAIRRYGLRTDFSDELLSAAAESASTFDRSGRTDFTSLAALTIDGPDTREIDDAISLTETARGRRLTIHLADPGAFVPVGDVVDTHALQRGLTHYFPDRKLNMFPPVISEEAASLNAGCERPSLSVAVDLDESGAVTDSCWQRAVVQSGRRLTYDEATQRLAQGGDLQLQQLDVLARQLERRRIDAGAIVIRSPEVELRVGSEGVVLRRTGESSPAQRIVEEAMILAGGLAAAWCREHRIDVIFRGQEAPVDLPPIPDGVARDPVLVRRVRRSLQRAEPDLRPRRHATLGFDAYMQMTSPLRRFGDLINQRQMAACLEEREAPYSEEELRRLLVALRAAERDARRAEGASRSYWMLRYLESKTGEVVDALVLDVEPRPLVQLTETLWTQAVPALAGVEPGQDVLLKIRRVNPRAGLLALSTV